MILRKVAVEPSECFPVCCKFHEALDFIISGPDISQPYRLSILAISERLSCQILKHGSGESISNHQRWRSKEVRTNVRVNSSLEIAIAGEDGGAYEIIGYHRFFNRHGQRARVANACGTAITGKIEAKLIEIGQETSFPEIFRHDT